jgi:hypothetical protein
MLICLVCEQLYLEGRGEMGDGRERGEWQSERAGRAAGKRENKENGENGESEEDGTVVERGAKEALE